MGKRGNKQRKERRYARPLRSAGSLPKSQSAVELSYPPQNDDDKLKIDLPSVKSGGVKEETVPVKTTTPDKKHRVSIMCDHRLEFPELYASVYLTGPDFDRRGFPEILARARCTLARDIEKADFVIFTGGADVDPQLYGASQHQSTHFNTDRDTDDINTYMTCLEAGIPMLGICRGAQFLHVMNGGKLFQHVNNHNSDHSMWDRDEKESIERVSSVHHQLVMPNTANGMHVIATTNRATEKWIDDKKTFKGSVDIEAFYYRDTVSLGIQGHPEYAGYNYFAYWMFKKIKLFFYENPDLELITGGFRRLKRDLIEQRKHGFISILPTVEQ